jgi:hypothetical protein
MKNSSHESFKVQDLTAQCMYFLVFPCLHW